MKAVRYTLPAALLLVLLSLPGLSQQSDSDQSWRTTGDLRNQAGTTNPTRVTRSHQVEDGKTVDVQTLQKQGINRDSELYGQTETETIKVNPTTTRVTTRHYVTEIGRASCRE